MSFLSALSKEPRKFQAGEEIGEQGQFANRRNGQPIVLPVNAEYPLLVDPAQVAAVEHFGVLRTRLLNAHSRLGIRSVIITSPQKEDGKSLVCANLATCTAQLGKYRVLLVDGDLRVKGITRLFGIQGDLGLSDFLQGTATLEKCIRSTDLPCLSVTGAGALREQSLPDILEGPKWPEFVEQAKQQFDLLVIDSVPVAAPIADFELLSAACDAVLLIVHLRKTTREAVDRSLQQLDRKLLGLIINNTEPRGGFDDYSYSHTSKKKEV